MEGKEEYKIDIQRYRNHRRSVPWKLIRKIVIVGVILGLLFYLNSTLKEKKESLPTEVELDLTD